MHLTHRIEIISNLPKIYNLTEKNIDSYIKKDICISEQQNEKSKCK